MDRAAHGGRGAPHLVHQDREVRAQLRKGRRIRKQLKRRASGRDRALRSGQQRTHRTERGLALAHEREHGRLGSLGGGRRGVIGQPRSHWAGRDRRRIGQPLVHGGRAGHWPSGRRVSGRRRWWPVTTVLLEEGAVLRLAGDQRLVSVPALRALLVPLLGRRQRRWHTAHHEAQTLARCQRARLLASAVRAAGRGGALVVPVPTRRLHALRVVWPRRERVGRHRKHDRQPHGVVDGLRRAVEHVVQLLALVSQRDSLAPALDAEELLELGCRERHHVEQGDLTAASDEVTEAYRSEKALRSLGRARRLVDHHGSTRGMLQGRHQVTFSFVRNSFNGRPH
jgi:hypothetical protein